MEAKNQILSPELRIDDDSVCAECLGSHAPSARSLGGDPLCAECASVFYVACAVCGGLVARDEAAGQETELYCAGCYAKAAAGQEARPLDDAEMEALVAEYVALHADEKRIKGRLDEIKEQLKSAAAARPRVANAVTLRTPAGSVKCSYSVKINCRPEAVAAAQAILRPEEFGALFESKLTYKARKEELEEFLSAADEEHSAAREAVRAAIEVVETPTLTVVQQKRGK